MCSKPDDVNVSPSFPALSVNNISKCYHIYNKPQDRLKQFLVSRVFPQKKYFQEFWALKGITFEVAKGDILGIIGRNGSGKSTLLQIICGTLFPTEGLVEISGRFGALLELGSGFNPDFTGSENINLSAAILGLTKEEIEERYDQIVEFADIGDFISQPVKTYSSGMYVRLAFAIQANIDPEILIIDEALAVGDAAFVHKCMLRFQQLREKGTTIIFVSHDATAVKAICNRAIWLDKGTIQASGQACEVVDRYLEAMVEQKVVLDHGANDQSGDSQGDESQEADEENIEKVLPNIDRRLGDQSCIFLGAELYNHLGQKAKAVNNDTDITIRVTIKNVCIPEGTNILLGYSLRNHRGVDLFSSNSEVEECYIPAPKQGKALTVRMKLHLPLLHPGSYAFNIDVGHRNKNGKIQYYDVITNCIVFDIISERLVYVYLSLETTFEVETK